MRCGSIAKEIAGVALTRWLKEAPSKEDKRGRLAELNASGFESLVAERIPRQPKWPCPPCPFPLSCLRATNLGHNRVSCMYVRRGHRGRASAPALQQQQARRGLPQRRARA